MNDDSLGIIASFIPIYSFDWREDDSSMVIIRIVSAVSLVYFVHQLSQEPQNIDDLYNIANSGFDDLFEWGSQRLVYGQLGGGGVEDGRPRKKSAQEIFMESLLGDDEEEEDNSKKEENIKSVEELEQEDEDEEEEIYEEPIKEKKVEEEKVNKEEEEKE